MPAKKASKTESDRPAFLKEKPDPVSGYKECPSCRGWVRGPNQSKVCPNCKSDFPPAEDKNKGKGKATPSGSTDAIAACIELAKSQKGLDAAITALTAYKEALAKCGGVDQAIAILNQLKEAKELAD